MADYWMKLYIEILDDPKMATLPDRVWRRVIELFLVAKRINKDGHLPDSRQIAWMLRMNPDELEQDMAQILMTGILEREVNGWFIPNFSQRQAAVPDAERKAYERSRKQSQQYSGNVTNLSRKVTQSRAETETEAEAETEAPAAAFFPGNRFERIYCTVTKHPGIPGGEIDKTLDALERIVTAKQYTDQQAVEYLKPYWDIARARYRNPSKCFWIYDWAMTERDLDELRKAPKPNGGSPQPGELYRDVATGNMIRA